MKPTEVTAKDCRTLADFLTKFKSMSYSQASVSDMVMVTDGIRWLQDLAMSMADNYSKSQSASPIIPTVLKPNGDSKRSKKND